MSEFYFDYTTILLKSFLAYFRAVCGSFIAEAVTCSTSKQSVLKRLKIVPTHYPPKYLLYYYHFTPQSIYYFITPTTKKIASCGKGRTGGFAGVPASLKNTYPPFSLNEKRPTTLEVSQVLIKLDKNKGIFLSVSDC